MQDDQLAFLSEQSGGPEGAPAPAGQAPEPQAQAEPAPGPDRGPDGKFVAKAPPAAPPAPPPPPEPGHVPISAMLDEREKRQALEKRLAEMDVDIEVEVQSDVGNIASEQFSEMLELVKMSPIYQQQAPLSLLIQLSTIPHKRSILDQIKQAGAQQDQANAQKEQIAQAAAGAHIEEVQAKAGLHKASAFAHVSNALTEAHAMHADHAVAGLEAGVSQAQTEAAQAASAQSQQTDIAAQQAAQQQQQAAAGQPTG